MKEILFARRLSTLSLSSEAGWGPVPSCSARPTAFLALGSGALKGTCDMMEADNSLSSAADVPVDVRIESDGCDVADLSEADASELLDEASADLRPVRLLLLFRAFSLELHPPRLPTPTWRLAITALSGTAARVDNGAAKRLPVRFASRPFSFSS